MSKDVCRRPTCPILSKLGESRPNTSDRDRAKPEWTRFAKIIVGARWQDRHCYVAMRLAYSPSARREAAGQMGKRPGGKGPRDRINHLQVVVDADERAAIKR